MSTTDLYLLNQKSTRHLAEFRNGWGSAPLVWDHLGAKYLGKKPTVFDCDDLREVWGLWGDSRLAHHERVVLLITFDKAFINIDKLADAAECCRIFGAECDDAKRVNHWPAIGDVLAQEARASHTKRARGVALSATSVSDPWMSPSTEWLSEAWPIYAEENS